MEREGFSMFLGTHTPRLDEKGRLILPAKFRDALTSGLVITKGQERCLVVWPTAEFTEYAQKLRTAAPTNSSVRAYTRVFFSSAYDEQPDKQGRVTLPPSLREYAGLDRDCIVVGADTRIEIWDTAAWETYLAASEPGFADLDGEVIPTL
jgi:MraZ protein